MTKNVAGLHVKYTLLVSDFNETWILPTYFRKMFKCQIWWKSVQWEPSCCMWTERQGEMKKPIDGFRSFAKASVNTSTTSNNGYTTCHSTQLKCQLIVINILLSYMFHTTWCFPDRASWIGYILITNLMHWLLFIHKILFSCTRFEPQVIIFRRIQLFTCSIWYCHSLWEFVVACRYTAWVRTDCSVS